MAWCSTSRIVRKATRIDGIAIPGSDEGFVTSKSSALNGGAASGLPDDGEK